MHSERIFSLNVWYLYGTTYPMMLSLHWTLQFFVPDLDLLTYHPFVRYIPPMFRQFVSARTHRATTCLLAYVCVFICMQSIKKNQKKKKKFKKTKMSSYSSFVFVLCGREQMPVLAPSPGNLLITRNRRNDNYANSFRTGLHFRFCDQII